MDITKFLERKWVIQTFGVLLIFSPFFNVLFQLFFLKMDSKLSWSGIDLLAYLASGTFLNYILSFASLVIGFIMLTGETKAWKAVLFLLGAHIITQIVNYKTSLWSGPMAWISFTVNVSMFLYIADQLVWKIKIPEIPKANLPKFSFSKEKQVMNQNQILSDENSNTVVAHINQNLESINDISNTMQNSIIEISENNSKADTVNLVDKKLTDSIESQMHFDNSIVHLTSYKKILFSFGDTKPWGRLVTMTSQILAVKSFREVPSMVYTAEIEVQFSKDLIIEIQFFKQEEETFYFKPIQMTSEQVKKLNKWFQIISVKESA